MKFSLEHNNVEKLKGSFIIAISEQGELTPSGKHIDTELKNLISKLFKSGDITGKAEQTLLLQEQTGLSAKHILVIGSGKTLNVTPRVYRKLMHASLNLLKNTSATHIYNFLPELTIEACNLPWKIKQGVEICSDNLYSFDEYKSVKPPKSHLQEISFHIGDQKELAACDAALKIGSVIAESISYTKNIANTPSNICNPNYLANAAKELGKQYKNVSVKVLEEQEMEKLGMNAFLAVTKGSEQDGKLIVLEYQGGPKTQAPIAFVGKGVTFDTGGISIKPSDAMVGMKYDMCGAATVLGVMRAAAEMNLEMNLVGVLAAVENMPSGTATKPEDIVKSLSGKTIEIMNTDAEGRLVLCDALTYCERYKPQTVIDIATLTGAVVIALGFHATGMLSNNDELANELLTAGNESYDRAWRLPLWDEYQDQLKSPFADMSNVGGRPAGTITAACFLSRFTEDYQWAHLDVAGTAAMMTGNDRYATGRPIPMLMQFLLNRSTNKKK